MKRTRKALMLLLSAALTLPFALAACGDPDDGTSGPSAASESSSAGEESQEVFVDTDAIAAIDALYTGEVDRTLNKVNLAAGRTYTFSRDPSDPYLDADGKKLTDGTTNDGFSKTDFVGFSGSAPVTIDLDLGAVADNIAEIDIGLLRVVDYAIGLPTRVTFSVSDDGENYTVVGDMLSPQGLADTVKYDCAVPLSGTIHARYVRIALTGMTAAWLFVDEIGVYKYEGENTGEESETVKDYYGELELEKSDEPLYWDSSESDYNDTVNLIAGKPVQIELVGPLQKEHATTFYNSPESNPALTDGKYASSATYTDSAFFRFTNGESRNLYFDLGRVSAVTSIRASFLREDGPNVKLPAGLLVYGSVDGEEWKVFHHVDSVYSEGEASIAKVDETFDKAYKARYIRITFSVLPHVYCDEIEILGRKNVDGAAELTESTAVNDLFPQEFITPDQFDGVENMLLAYNCNPTLESEGKATVEEYLPHVGYYNRDGELVDTFFDSFLYLPYAAFTGVEYRDFAAWNTYVDNVFAENANINALTQAVDQVSEALGRDVRVSVFFSILYTWPDKTEFGDVDGDGIVEDFSKVEDRKKAIKWIIDEQISRFEAGGYDNLDLLGFYWFEEQITYSNPNETELIRYASDYVHSLGYKLFWIPYNYASGYSEWKSLGFDMACMQPNYAFRYNTDRDILYRTAETTKLLGMCVEIEINIADNPVDVARYKEYLGVGAETGYMNAVKVYYQGGLPGEFYKAYLSDNKYTNSVYHDTYAFAKGTFSEETQSGIDEIVGCDDMELECRAGSGVSGQLEIDTEASYSVKLAVSPKYGAVRLNADGSFSYTSRKGFDVTDTFYVYADYGYGLSDPIAITVHVNP